MILFCQQLYSTDSGNPPYLSRIMMIDEMIILAKRYPSTEPPRLALASEEVERSKGYASA